MVNNNFIIRSIQKKDNSKIATVIREVLIEFGVPKVGTAYADKTLDTMFEYYDSQNAIYYVVEKEGEIYGGAGIKQLDNFEGRVCELQKMYFNSKARGVGVGKELILICLQKAKEFGFEKCYLETLPYMEAARKLYKKVGFESINERMGDTGHYSCNLFMVKDL